MQLTPAVPTRGTNMADAASPARSITELVSPAREATACDQRQRNAANIGARTGSESNSMTKPISSAPITMHTPFETIAMMFVTATDAAHCLPSRLSHSMIGSPRCKQTL